MESTDLLKIIEVLKANKVQHYKNGDVEISFSYDAFDEPNSNENNNDISQDNDLLFLSSGVKGVKRGHSKQ